MKTIIAIPENKEEWKNWIKENKKKILTTAGGAVLLVTGLALGKTLTDKKNQIEDSDETPFLPEAEVEPEEEENDFMDEESEEENNEEDETDEEGDAE